MEHANVPRNIKRVAIPGANLALCCSPCMNSMSISAYLFVIPPKWFKFKVPFSYMQLTFCGPGHSHTITMTFKAILEPLFFDGFFGNRYDTHDYCLPFFTFDFLPDFTNSSTSLSNAANSLSGTSSIEFLLLSVTFGLFATSKNPSIFVVA